MKKWFVDSRNLVWLVSSWFWVRWSRYRIVTPCEGFSLSCRAMNVSIFWSQNARLFLRRIIDVLNFVLSGIYNLSRIPVCEFNGWWWFPMNVFFVLVQLWTLLKFFSCYLSSISKVNMNSIRFNMHIRIEKSSSSLR